MNLRKSNLVKRIVEIALFELPSKLISNGDVNCLNYLLTRQHPTKFINLHTVLLKDCQSICDALVERLQGRLKNGLGGPRLQYAPDMRKHPRCRCNCTNRRLDLDAFDSGTPCRRLKGQLPPELVINAVDL